MDEFLLKYILLKLVDFVCVLAMAEYFLQKKISLKKIQGYFFHLSKVGAYLGWLLQGMCEGGGDKVACLLSAYTEF